MFLTVVARDVVCSIETKIACSREVLQSPYSQTCPLMMPGLSGQAMTRHLYGCGNVMPRNNHFGRSNLEKHKHKPVFLNENRDVTTLSSSHGELPK
ncbi:hypothetical protein TMES_18890 [Thalassospira mesophila]|uniref:Uncharacterized protein n=1 Tax=Thalassospira mesophila TaxID=1293891 RepID=A0A1Y2KW29_9PROT|nr:hypothetical protein TMES_18890 [Thalassospira mesophila]